MTRWSIRALIAEGARNTLAAVGPSMLLGVFSVALLVAVGEEAGSALDRSEELRESLRRAGANVLVIGPAPNAAKSVITAEECALLEQRPDVLRAGAVFTTDFVRVPTMPSTQYRQLTATSGAAAILLDDDSDTSGPGAVVSPALAERLGLAVGSMLGAEGTTTNSALSEVAAVRPLDLRRPELGRAALVILPPVGMTNECLVEIVGDGPPDESLVDLLAAFSAPPRSITLRHLTAGGTFQRSPLDEYRQRPGRWLWIAAALGLVGMWTLILMAQRAELGLYASFLVRRPHAVVLTMTQFALSTAPAAGAALITLLCLAEVQNFSNAALNAAAQAMLQTLGFAWLGAALAPWVVMRGGISDQLKDR